MTGELATASHDKKKISFFFLKHKAYSWSTVHKWFAGKGDRCKILTYCKITAQRMQSSPKRTVSQQTSPADVVCGPQSISDSKHFLFCFLRSKGCN